MFEFVTTLLILAIIGFILDMWTYYQKKKCNEIYEPFGEGFKNYRKVKR